MYIYSVSEHRQVKKDSCLKDVHINIFLFWQTVSKKKHQFTSTQLNIHFWAVFNNYVHNLIAIVLPKIIIVKREKKKRGSVAWIYFGKME